MAQRFKNLKEYHKYLHPKQDCVPCPLCHDLVLPKHYEKHCTEQHHLNAKLSCVWCSGKVSWPSQTKSRNADHLIECCRRFLALNVAPRTFPAHAIGFDMTTFCPEKDLFGRSPDPHPKAYAPIWPQTLHSAPLTYSMESLNLAAGCVQTYLDLKDTTYWVHVMVRSVAFQSFLDAMEGDQGQTQTLPFSCWCDGGRHKEARHRRHRHCILVSPSQDHFDRNVWNRIRIAVEERPYPNFRCVHRKPIQSALHLVHVLGYVSQRESTCEMAGDAVRETACHYHIFVTLPRDYPLPLVLQWDGGLRQFLDQACKNLKWGELVRADMKFVDRKWRIPVRCIPGVPFGKGLPVTRDLRPCDRPTDLALHLLNGKKQYFERRRDDASPSETVTLFDAVGDEGWTPHPYQTKLIHAFKPLVDRNAELESEITLHEEDRQKWLADLERAHAETDRWKRKWSELESENAELRAQNDELRAQNDELSEHRVP